jgi:hypothetical protein
MAYGALAHLSTHFHEGTGEKLDVFGRLTQDVEG